MAEGNTLGGGRKSSSRSVLGDITNWSGKRGFSGREKKGVVCFDFNDKDVVKRICASPRKINSLKGNVVSSRSKIPDENRDPNMSSCGRGNAASKNSTDKYDDCDVTHRLKGKDVVVGNSKFHSGNNDIKILDPRGNVVSQSVNELGDSCDQIECSKDALPGMDKVASQNNLDPVPANLEGGKVLNSIPSEADDCILLDLNSSKENKILGTAEVVNENKCSSLEHSVGKNVVDPMIIGGSEFLSGSSEMHNKENDPDLDSGRGDTIQSINTEAKDESDDSSSADTSKTVSETGNDCLHDGKNCDAGEMNISIVGTQSDLNSHHNDLDDHNVDNFVLSQSGSIDCTILPESQESGAFGIDRSAKLKEDEHAYMAAGRTDSIRACSCSFCTKAANIWLDLHQKDIKARLSALKKSQKDASILAERSCRIKVNEKHGAESSTRVSKLESHLMYQWRSLFQHMANIWEEEGNQLEASLLPLNNLRDKCKAELELINSELPEKH